MNSKKSFFLNTKAVMLRRKFGFDAFTTIDILGLIRNFEDHTIIFCPLSNRISGMSYKLNDEFLIVINSNLSLGRQRYTAAHELYHLNIQEKTDYTVCENSYSSRKPQEEIDADQFASYFLAPNEALNLFLEEVLSNDALPLGMESIIRIEQYFQMSHKATLVRLERDGFITQEIAAANSENVKKHANRLGFSTALYEPQIEKNKFFPSGNYIKNAIELYESGKISKGKYDELLIDVFQEDLVINNSNDLEEILND